MALNWIYCINYKDKWFFSRFYLSDITQHCTGCQGLRRSGLPVDHRLSDADDRPARLRFQPDQAPRGGHALCWGYRSELGASLHWEWQWVSAWEEFISAVCCGVWHMSSQGAAYAAIWRPCCTKYKFSLWGRPCCSKLAFLGRQMEALARNRSNSSNGMM